MDTNFLVRVDGQRREVDLVRVEQANIPDGRMSLSANMRHLQKCGSWITTAYLWHVN
jgi:hypothetical protein